MRPPLLAPLIRLPGISPTTGKLVSTRRIVLSNQATGVTDTVQGVLVFSWDLRDLQIVRVGCAGRIGQGGR